MTYRSPPTLQGAIDQMLGLKQLILRGHFEDYDDFTSVQVIIRYCLKIFYNKIQVATILDGDNPQHWQRGRAGGTRVPRDEAGILMWCIGNSLRTLKEIQSVGPHHHDYQSLEMLRQRLCNSMEVVKSLPPSLTIDAADNLSGESKVRKSKAKGPEKKTAVKADMIRI